MANEPYDDREVSAELEVHTPNWLPGAKLKTGFQRKWNRVDRFFDGVADASGLTHEELEDRISQGDEITDLVITAGQRAAEKGNHAYSDLLARLVAAALIDDAKVDPISYLMDRIVQLDPVHLRILETLRAAEIADRAMMEGQVDSEEFKGTKPAIFSQL